MQARSNAPGADALHPVPDERFDEDCYRRFDGDSRTRVSDRGAVSKLVILFELEGR